MTAPHRAPGVGTRIRHLLPRSIRRAASRVVAERRAAEVERALARLAADRRPIAIGPWLGEVGFEILYWVPFVRWFAERFDVGPDRLIAVTRGGAAAWYAPMAARSLDALAFMDADDFRDRNEARSGQLGEQKQIAMTPLDEEILAIVRKQEGRDVAVLHPSLMYRLFAPDWWGHQPRAWVERFARFAPLQRPAVPLDLPPDYTAVKFYFNDCFAPTVENRAFVERTVRGLAAEGPVISLSTGLAVDGHDACDAEESSGIGHLLTPDTNLLVQSAIVARARRFVGTYGGFAYLAPFYRVPSLSFYSDADGFSRRHLELAAAVTSVGGGTDLLRVQPVPGAA